MIIKYFIGLIIILLGAVAAEAIEIECYECDASNPNCTQNVKEGTKLTNCTEGICFIGIDSEGHNIRGCLNAENAKICNDPNTCKNCTQSRCNDKNFPEDRTVCAICKGDECKEPSEKMILPCEIYKKGDKCYTYFDSVNTIRGCTSKRNDLCANNPSYCEECENADVNKICNNGTLTNLYCFKCDNDEDCKRSVEKCEDVFEIKDPVICKIDKNKNLCYTQIKSNNNVTRGCAIDIKEETIEGLTFCHGNKCNNKCIPDIKCPICQEHDDPTCSKNDNQTNWYKESCNPYTTVCHSCLNLDASTMRGCGKPANNQTMCNFCYENNCIAPVPKPKRTCYKCDKNDPKCSRSPTVSGISTVVCPDTLTQCFTKLNADNLIERGCTKSDDKCDDNSDDKCKICNEHNCNIDIIPATRRLCYQCDSKTTPNCAEPSVKDSKVEGYPCQIYKENDTCYTTYSDTNTMIRGCSSDPLLDPNREKCEKNTEFCIHCNNSNCNNLPFLKSSKLLCFQCNINDTNCVWSQDTNTAKSCQQLEFWKNETCFSYIDSITNVARGCIHDADNKHYNCTDEKNDKCKRCYTNGCNIESYGKQQCYRCRSDAPGQIECSHNKLKNIKPSDCRNNFNNSNDKGCFTEKYHGIVLRGCLIDLYPEMQANCKNKNYTDCTYCDGINCNDGIVPGGNSSTSNFISYLVLILSYILYLIM